MAFQENTPDYSFAPYIGSAFPRGTYGTRQIPPRDMPDSEYLEGLGQVTMEDPFKYKFKRFSTAEAGFRIKGNIILTQANKYSLLNLLMHTDQYWDKAMLTIAGKEKIQKNIKLINNTIMGFADSNLQNAINTLMFETSKYNPVTAGFVALIPTYQAAEKAVEKLKKAIDPKAPGSPASDVNKLLGLVKIFAIVGAAIIGGSLLLPGLLKKKKKVR